MQISWGLIAFVFGRQVIKMLVIVVALFALCWLPVQTYNVLQDVFSEING
jgi:leucokinin receptor